MSQQFELLKKDLLSCRLCEERFGFEPHPVLIGNDNSKIMQIGQAPSRTVHQTLMPFTDASGKKLKYEWYRISDEVFYNPDNFYITSIGHCYPGKSPNGGDRLPPKCCAKKWLVKEVEAVNNKIFILIGGQAAGFFFPKENFTELVFRDLKLNGKPAYVLPHPSPLNIKWFKDNPAFLDSRILEIEKIVHQVLNIR